VKAGKTALAAHAMVNAIWAGTVQSIYIVSPGEAGAANQMAAFYHELNKQMPWRDKGDFAALVDVHGHILQQ
jgi:hypothetical protein